MTSKYTVTCDHSAPGEGRTLMVLVCMAGYPEEAIDLFIQNFGPQFNSELELHEGFPAGNEVVQAVISPNASHLLQREDLWLSFDATLHYIVEGEQS